MREGRQAATEISKTYDIYDGLPALQNYVNEIGQKLARKSHRPQLDYHFTVVDSPEVNAFALPGGHIYVTRGILAYLNSEPPLAAWQSLLGVTGSALLSGYGRSHELEADRLGAEYLARSGYDPQAMIKVISVLKNQELFDIEAAKQEGREPRRYHGIFATHPDNDTRLQEVVGEANRYAQPGKFDDHHAEFLHQTEGMIFGDDASQGVVRGNTFQHKQMGFMLSFPPGWRIRNKPDEVVAVSPDGEAMVVLGPLGDQRGAPADLAQERFRPESPAEILSMTSNGLPVAVVTPIAQGERPFKAAMIYHEDKAYLVAGRGDSPAAFARYRDAISGTIESFRALTDAEKKSARALEIRTIKAANGLSYAGLAKESPLGVNAESYLRLLNGQYPEGEPAAGQIIKIVK